MRACVLSYEGQIFELRRPADDKAFMVVSVSKRRSRSEESMATSGVSAGILGFGRKRPWSTSVWLVSLGKALICTNMKGRGLLRPENVDTAVSHGGCMMLWSLDLKLSRGTLNLC